MSIKAFTPYQTVADADEAFGLFVEQGCDRDLYLYESIDDEYSTGFVISTQPERLFLGERRVKFVKIYKFNSRSTH